MVAVVGRLVPHKRVEHAIDAVLELRARHPGLRLHVVGGGWWEARLHEYAERLGAGDTVVFEGHVDEARKHEIYERAWLLALPSLKEGWGLVVGEAGMHGTPTVAYREAGGTQESVVDGYSGVLADDRAGFTTGDRGAARRRGAAGAAGPRGPGDESCVHLGACAGVVRHRGPRRARRAAAGRAGPGVNDPHQEA